MSVVLSMASLLYNSECINAWAILTQHFSQFHISICVLSSYRPGVLDLSTLTQVYPSLPETLLALKIIKTTLMRIFFQWKYKIKSLLPLLRIRHFWGAIYSFYVPMRTPIVHGVQWQCLTGVYGGEKALPQLYVAR